MVSVQFSISKSEIHYLLNSSAVTVMVHSIFLKDTSVQGKWHSSCTTSYNLLLLLLTSLQLVRVDPFVRAFVTKPDSF